MAAICVIIPVYKVEPYLRRCVDSILHQTFSDFELVLVDDGSPDNCGAMCDEYARQDSRIHVIHQENGGLSAARNAGLDWFYAHSDGQWITFVDSDDWIHCRTLEYLLNMAKQNQVNISICNYARTHGEQPELSLEGDTPKLCSPEELFVTNNVLGVISCGKLFGRSLFSDIRYPVGRFYEDEYIIYKLLFREKKLAITMLPLYFYFWNDEGLTKSLWSPGKLDIIQALNEQAAFFKRFRFKRAYAFTTLWYMEVIRNQRQNVKEASLSDKEKETCFKYLDRALRRAALSYADIYLRQDPYLYLNAFPWILKCYQWLRGKKA